ncbi:hypothetical protein [Salinactinospora qingdaonensis]|uniref:PQQ-like domain-containing protein n=1 Tax=Salinactinospora qingdaonensis TaxID=702744 RepID=A0ABP7F2X3_9ACTN
MRTWGRTGLAVATGLGLLLGTGACTDEPAPQPSPSPSPSTVPTTYSGASPPGLADEPIRYLRGAETTGSGVLDDPLGVRVQPVGDAFLISSSSEQRHILQRAADGATLWEGSRRIDRFTTDRAGEDVFVVAPGSGDEGGTTAAVDAAGNTVWTSALSREDYVNGWVVRRPEGWSPDAPYGAFAIHDLDGDEVWAYEFTEEHTQRAEPEESGTPTADETSASPRPSPTVTVSGANGSPAPEDIDPERTGVPVGAGGDILLLRDGAGTIQARNLSAEGEALWRLGDSAGETAPGGASFERPEPQIVGIFDLPEQEEPQTSPAASAASPSPSPSPSASTSASTSPSPASAPDPRRGVLLRWSYSESESYLSMSELASGALLWSVAEPGYNPIDREFSVTPVAGTIYDAASGTLLLPQRSGETPFIAVDVASGEILWRFESDAERAISPAFALNGYFYGDSRGADDSNFQVVLDADTKDVVSDDLAGYVEAVTDDGHALVVQNRQRFVFAADPDSSG